MKNSGKRKILICGSTGFIGRNIAEEFARSDNFIVYGTFFKSKPLNNKRIKMIKADLTDGDDVVRAVKGKDIIIQAAAATSGSKGLFTKPHYYVTDNAIMNSLIFKAAYDHKVSHLLFFSCTIMYQSSDSPLKETDFDANKEIHPCYFGGGWTKVYNEKMCEFYSRIGPTKYTVIRHSNIYGPYNKFDLERSHVLAATITKVMTAKEGTKVLIWGKGDAERDLLYISDLIDFVKLAIEKQNSRFELFNVGIGSRISVTDLAKKIIEASGKNIGLTHDLSKPAISTKLCLDITKANKLLGWSPKVTLDEGISKAIDWYKENSPC